MIRLIAIALVSFCAISMAADIAPAITTWGVTGTDSHRYVVDGSGNPVDQDGATVTLRAQQADPAKFGGSYTTLDATPYRGRTLMLSADLDTHDATRGAAIWLRADDEMHRSIAFDNSQQELVQGTISAAHREIGIAVPTAARHLVFGTILMGSGDVVARHVHLSVATASTVQPAAVLDSAIRIVRAHALHARDVDWATVEPQLRAMTKDAKAPADVYPAIRSLLKSLGDHHSFFMEPLQAHRDVVGGRPSSPPVVALKQNCIGYIDMPGYRGMDPTARHAFVDNMVGSITRMAGQARCGWVVDLRKDTGGSMLPMLAGLRPLLGDQPLGSFRDADGHLSSFGAANRMDKTPPQGPALEQATVAVLLGPHTASSGEVVAVAFEGRPHTRSFGQATAGLSTGNATFKLPDGSMLVLTTVIDVDRTGHAYGSKMQPDETIISSDAESDATLEAAIAWLRHQSAGS